MAYSQFTLSDIKSKFHVPVELATDVFAAVPPQDLSPLLAETLQENVPLALAVSTGKARSECIVAPILIELRKIRRPQISVFSCCDTMLQDLPVSKRLWEIGSCWP